MKNLRKYAVVSVIATLVVLAMSLTSVKASSGLMFTLNSTTGNDTNASTNTSTNASTNASTNISASTANSTTNIASTTGNITNKSINDGLTKDNIPQAGENDIYIISGIGIIAIVIGGVAYIRSRKYNM